MIVLWTSDYILRKQALVPLYFMKSSHMVYNSSRCIRKKTLVEGTCLPMSVIFLSLSLQPLMPQPPLFHRLLTWPQGAESYSSCPISQRILWSCVRKCRELYIMTWHDNYDYSYAISVIFKLWFVFCSVCPFCCKNILNRPIRNPFQFYLQCWLTFHYY